VSGGEACPICGLTYEDFKTGLTFREVWTQFWSGSEDPSTWVNKRRRTVLGRWHQIKEEMWREHLHMCEMQAEWEAQQEADAMEEWMEYDDDVPF
jgi:hypothetical protein